MGNVRVDGAIPPKSNVFTTWCQIVAPSFPFSRWFFCMYYYYTCMDPTRPWIRFIQVIPHYISVIWLKSLWTMETTIADALGASAAWPKLLWERATHVWWDALFAQSFLAMKGDEIVESWNGRRKKKGSTPVRFCRKMQIHFRGNVASGWLQNRYCTVEEKRENCFCRWMQPRRTRALVAKTIEDSHLNSLGKFFACRSVASFQRPSMTAIWTHCRSRKGFR